MVVFAVAVVGDVVVGCATVEAAAAAAAVAAVAGNLPRWRKSTEVVR